MCLSLVQLISVALECTHSPYLCPHLTRRHSAGVHTTAEQNVSAVSLSTVGPGTCRVTRDHAWSPATVSRPGATAHPVEADKVYLDICSALVKFCGAIYMVHPTQISNTVFRRESLVIYAPGECLPPVPVHQRSGGSQDDNSH